jgi:hypothetical protein
MPRVISQQITAVKRSRKKGRRRQKSGGDAVGRYASDAWSLAKRTAYGLNEIRKLINIESKITEGTWGYAPDRTGFIQPLTLIAQGTDYLNERVGDSIKLQRIEFKMKLLMDAASTGTVVRVILFRDLFQTGGGTPAPADLLEDVGSTYSPLSPLNYLLRDRFGIVSDNLVDLSSSGNQCATLVVDTAHEGHVKFVGTTNTTASAGPGQIYLYLVSDESAHYPSVSVMWRVTYTDD